MLKGKGEKNVSKNTKKKKKERKRDKWEEMLRVDPGFWKADHVGCPGHHHIAMSLPPRRIWSKVFDQHLLVFFLYFST